MTEGVDLMVSFDQPVIPVPLAPIAGGSGFLAVGGCMPAMERAARVGDTDGMSLWPGR